MNRSSLRGVIVAAITVCGTPSVVFGAVTESPATVPSETITVARDVGLMDWPILAAERLGFFEDLSVGLDNVSVGASQALQALLAGELDIAVSAYHPVIILHQQQGAEEPSDLIGIGETIVRPPFGLFVRDGIETIADLEGATLGISTELDAAGITLRELLAENGVDPETVTFLPVGRGSERLAALQAGGIDGTILVPPATLNAADAGFTQLAWLPDLQASDDPNSFFSFVTTRSWATEHRDVVVRFLAAVDRGLSWLAEPANREAAIHMVVDADIVDRGYAERSYDVLVAGGIFNLEVSVSLPGFEENLNALEILGELTERPAADLLLDPSFAEAAREIEPS